MITIKMLERWLTVPAENERLEFKKAERQYDTVKLLKYCSALANERGGHLVLGVTDKPPRQVVGTMAFPSESSLNGIKSRIVDKLGFRVEVTELDHTDGRVLVFEVPSRPLGQPVAYEGAYLMRSGEDLRAMTPDMLKRIFAEDDQEWFLQPARTGAGPEEVIALLDSQTYFELMNQHYPTTRNAVLGRLESEGLIIRDDSWWTITNLAAIVLAKRLDAFPVGLARKAPRFVIYDGTNKIKTREDKPGTMGYAVGFRGLIDFVHSSAPQNRFIEEVVREEVKMFPKQALRELIANALIHQDFQVSGSSLMIEMYDDRVEVSNPGTPPISVDRFIDEYQSRNERLADLMRRMGICEEKGSGIDKVVSAAEMYQLPAPDFRAGNSRTTAVLFAHQEFAEMSKTDRIRACYQHCALQYVSNNKMSNQSLRQRFGLDDSNSSSVTASQVIAAAKAGGLIKPDDSDSSSLRYARYVPWWA